MLPKLKISDNRRAIVTADGKPFFYLADTAWELFHRLTFEEADTYLQNRAAKGFNVIQAVALAECDGLNQPDRNGHKPLADNDPTRPNEPYWQHVDAVVKRANELGLYIGLLPTWGDKWNKKWGAGPEIFTPENARAYAKWLANRYRDNAIIWILGGDRPIENDLHRQITEAFAEGLREGDGGSHLITFHPTGGQSSSIWFADSNVLDIHMIQSGHSHGPQALKLLRNDWSLTSPRPFINGEPAYEAHPNNFQGGYEGWLDESDVRRDLYYTICSGAAGYTYGAHPIWQFCNPLLNPPINQPRMTWRKALELPGVKQLAIAKKLLEELPTILREPADSFLNTQDKSILPAVACRDAEGLWALIYLPDSQTVDINLAILSKYPAEAMFINPRTGQITATEQLAATETTHRFIPPASFDNTRDSLLLLKTAR
ncbi:MAG: DUF4038 domain-containing protein [Victivallales bacterium]|nr:DUF4038 domain-containing protein [Victivallales bacterium]